MKLVAAEAAPESEYREVCKRFCDALNDLLAHSEIPEDLKHNLNYVMMQYLERRALKSFTTFFENAGELVISAMSVRGEVGRQHVTHIDNDECPF